MYKKNTVFNCRKHICVYQKLFRIMRLLTIMVLVAVMHVNANTLAQGIDFHYTNVTLEEAFVHLQKRSGYDFLYDAPLIKKANRVTISVKNADITEVMDKLLANQPLAYVINKKTISIKAKQQPSNITIRGKVTDEAGQPLAGATIRIKGTSVAFKTDDQGNFELPASYKDATLQVVYIGYVTRELPAQLSNNIVMKKEATVLDEVVAIAYGEVKRRDLTGSVGSVKMEELEKAPIRSFEEALAGRVAGVQVSSENGKPGSGINVIIRGTNSLTQNNSPLWVIDGFPVEDPDNNMIDPSQVESIDVLKDASATAIYGARAANGVILITTKQGKIGAPVVDYSGYYGAQKTINRITLMEPYEFVKLQNEIDPISTERDYFRDGKTLEDYRNEPGTDWQDKLFRTAPIQNHALTISGGTLNTKYLFSGNLMRQDGVIINSGFDRKQGRVNLDQVISPKFKVGTNMTYNSNKTFGTTPSAPDSPYSAMNYLMYSVWGYRPVTFGGTELDDMLVDPDVNPYNDYRINPILSAKNELRQSFSENFRGNAYGEYLLAKGLKLRISGGLNKTTIRDEIFNNSQTRYGYFRSTDRVNGSIRYTTVDNWLNENTLRYDKKINKNHTFNVLGGMTFQGNAFHRYGVKAIKLPNESLGLSGLDEGIQQPITAQVSDWHLMSFLSRINYNYKGKYLLTASYRADGSSKFRVGNRWGYFPSGALAWRAIDENFVKKVKFLSDAKARLSWGITGNNRVSDYATYAQLTFDNVSQYAFNNSLHQGFYPSKLSNKDLKWESTMQTNLGLDLGFLRQRLTLTADYYYKETTDLLLDAKLPLSTGYGSVFKNIGKTSNTGLELSLASVNINGKNFDWNSSFNISFNNNKVLELTENQEALTSTVSWDQYYRETPAYIVKVGQPLGQIYGFIWEGVYPYEDFDLLPNGSYLLKDNISDNGNDRSKIRPGDIKYRDLNGDKKVDNNDRTVIGRSYPLHQGGFSNNFRYKHLDLNVFLQWSYGNDILNANRLLFERGDKVALNQFATYENRWSPENTSSTMARVGGDGPDVYSSRTVEDGSYLRLKTVSLGYNFSPELLKKSQLKGLRAYLSAQNLFTWTNYSGYDPEVAVYYSALTPGFDYSAYPRANTIVMGVNIKL